MVAKKQPRGTSMVVSAIRKLRDAQGASSREIVNFLSSACDISDPTLKRQVQMALKRGMSYGIIHRGKGGYYLSNPAGLSVSNDTLVDRGRCKGRRRRRMSRRRGCKRRRSRCGRRRSRRSRRSRGSRRRGRKCRGKRRSRRSRRGKRRCGRRGRRHAGDDEMDEMAPTSGRAETRRNRIGRTKFQQRNKSPGDRSSATRSSRGGSTPLDSHPTEL